MNTTENNNRETNILIAELKTLADFMEIVFNTNEFQADFNNSMYSKILVSNMRYWDERDNNFELNPYLFLLFHSSWDWLMEVVEKINQLENQRFTVLINSMDCKVFDNIKNKIISDSFGRFNPDELKLSVYNACVAFIEWYNKQKSAE